MIPRALACLTALVAAACSAVDVGLEPADRSDTSTSSGAEDPPDSTGTSASAESSSSPLESGSDTAAAPASTGTDATDADSGSSEDGTTDGLEGSPCNAEQEVCALVQQDGMPSGFCGETFELVGITQPNAGGGWTLQDCGACELCGGPEYTIDIIAPAGWAPEALPLCSRVSIDYAPMDSTPWACAFLGVSIWGNDGLGEDPAPVYIASSITSAPPSGIQGLVVDPINIAPEMCAMSSCCFEEPGKYTFTFTGAGLDEPLTLAEHEEELQVDIFSRTYSVRNLRSHAHKECGKIPHFDWVFRR